MIVVKTAKQLRDQIVAFNETVNVSSFNPSALLKQTCDEYPETLAYLFSCNAQANYLGGVTLNLGYRNKDVKINFIKKADDLDDLMDFFHETVSYYRLKSVVIIKSNIDWQKAYNDFFNEFHAYYSNLTQFGIEGSSTFNDRLIAITLTCTYRIGSVMLGIMERKVDEEVARLKSVLFCPDMSDMVKAYVAHNYLAKSITYFNNENSSPLERSYLQSAYGALINKKCVCQGYAEAYKRIMDEAGVKCSVVCGKIKEDGEHHAWNVVVLNGRAYHVDVTWDSLGNGLKRDDYFAKNDQFMLATRTWQRNSRYVCNDSRNILPEIRAEIMVNTRNYLKAGVDKIYLRNS